MSIHPPPTNNLFAHAGARLSFQKRVDEDAKASQLAQAPPPTAPLVGKLKSSRKDNGPQKHPVHQRIVSENIALDTSLHRSASSAALLAAAAAAAQTTKPLTTPPLPPPRRPKLEKDLDAAKPLDSGAPVSTSSNDIKQSYLAAAKASVQKSNSSSAMAAQRRTNNIVDRQPLPSNTPLSTSTASSAISSPSNSVISVAMLDSKSRWATKAAKLSTAGSAKDQIPIPTKMNPQAVDVSSQAACSITNKRPPALPVTELDKESKFGIILTRPVSPTRSHHRLSSGPASPQKNVGSIYRLPELTASEPALPTGSLKSFWAPSKAHTASPLVPLASRPQLGDFDSSDGSSSGGFGAAIRSPSAVSLPAAAIIENGELSTRGPSTNRRRPVHLKTTMRKELRPERAGHHNHPGPQAMTEQERKRYEGVWAANHRGDHPTSAEHLDNFIVREVWSRSQLPPEILGHIW